MNVEGSLVGRSIFFRLADASKPDTPILVEGVVLEVEAKCVVAAVDSELATRFGGLVFEVPAFGALRLPHSQVLLDAPQGWRSHYAAPTPPLRVLQRTYMRSEDLLPETSADEVLAPAAGPSTTRPLPGLEGSKVAKDKRLMGLIGQLYGGLQAGADGSGEASSDDETSSEGSREGPRLRATGASSSNRPLRPGTAAAKGGRREADPVGDAADERARSHKAETKKETVDPLESLLGDPAAAAAAGLKPKDLIQMYFLKSLMDQNKEKRRRGRPSGGGDGDSSSDDDYDRKGGSGHRHGRAIEDLRRFEEDIINRPKRITRKFEEKMAYELGVTPGQPWSVRDYVKKWRWGTHRGLLRGAVQDAAVYELLAAGKHHSALAQLAQNLKSKQQAALAGGDFSGAWLLTGLPDPLGAPRFAGEGHEMATLASYLSSVKEIEARTKGANFRAGIEAGDTEGVDEEGDGHGASKGEKRRARKAAARAKAKADPKQPP